MTSRGVFVFVSVCQAALAGCDSDPMGVSENAAQIEVLGETESSRDFGDYVVHVNALTTDQLTPEIASEYAIVRSPSRALLNVNIQRRTETGATVAVAGTVEASAVNLMGQLQTLLIREIREGEAIYYIAETPVTNSESLIFTVEVTPQDEPEALTVRFRKQFFVD